MKPGLSQSIRLGQELKLNPRLYQAMDMLYMPLLDLQQHLKQEMLVNPFLELAEDDVDDGDTTTEQGDADEAADGETEAKAEGEGESADADGADVQPLDVSAEPIVEGDTEPQAVDLVDAVATSDEPPPTGDDDFDRWDEVLSDGFEPDGARSGEEEDTRDFTERTPIAAAGLDGHLREQLRLLELSPRDLLLADEFVGSIGDDGYLTSTLDEIRDGINDVVRAAAERAGRDEDDDVPLYTTADVERMLGIIQGLDPSGVGARDLRECLLIQLRALGRDDTLAARLVREQFDELIAHRWAEIARRIGCSAAEAQAAADEIAKLNPKPGLLKSASPDNYVIPDLIVDKIDGEYLVFINDGNLPRLRLSRVYQDLARDRKKLDQEQRDFIASKLNAAQWLVQAIEQRRQTMLKVMHFIVNRQREFFDKGIQYLKPLTLREVADAVGMHESTISRVTNEKYAQTPRGMLPLKFFFSSGLATSAGEDVSARGIKATIEKLVKDEDVRNPLTDQAIVEILEKQGVQIARRTVAKYRDQLGVLSARMRRRV